MYFSLPDKFKLPTFHWPWPLDNYHPILEAYIQSCILIVEKNIIIITSRMRIVVTSVVKWEDAKGSKYSLKVFL